ncbi:TlpA family protein disulfide reductase [Maribacter sp. 2307ULW6-5]|uniref:TlpA family protein disulfide reductase n=1 Tax=Maribacter sp. 2307ULW6-5 TaxID=3386275 RepID=UPI0039BC72B5
MKKGLLCFLILFTSMGLRSQNQITGVLSPPEEFKWLIAYRLIPGSQRYVADTQVNDGSFVLSLPKGAPAGTYRLVYAVPQEEFYVDVFYNGKENIELHFDLQDGSDFVVSEENRTWADYLEAMAEVEKAMAAVPRDIAPGEWQAILQRQQDVQEGFLERSAGLMVRELIMANKPFVPKEPLGLKDYFVQKKKGFLDSVPVGSSLLQTSGLLKNKVLAHVYTDHPEQLEGGMPAEAQMQLLVDQAQEKLTQTPQKYQLDVLFDVWNIAQNNGLHQLTDHVATKYLQKLATDLGDTEMAHFIEAERTLRLGNKAPDMAWQGPDGTQNLWEMEGAANYVLVFWSSGCSHCLKELPLLHEKVGQLPNTKVIAVGLEEDEVPWRSVTEEMPLFAHALSLGKWDSELAKTYDIRQTPTYFVLDAEKRFVHKPQDYGGVLRFFSVDNE